MREALREWLGITSLEAATNGIATNKAIEALTAQVAELEARVAWLEQAPPAPQPKPPATTLEGVGSRSTSLASHPRTGDVIDGDLVVDAPELARAVS